nr:HU family DNA-binding protein [uncultured Blautia sp.]
MNKTIYETEFTKMVHDKLREANRFKEYERIPKNRIGGDYWNTYWTIRYMLRTIEDILANGDKLSLKGYFTVAPKLYKERAVRSGMERTGKNVYEVPDRYLSKFKPCARLKRACKEYENYLKEEANNQDDGYEEGEENE